MSKVKITLTRSLAGKSLKNKKIINSMGLRKIGQSKEFNKTAPIEGMIRQVSYLIKVEEI